MIQILGLRDFIDDKGRKRKRETFFSKGWRLEKVQDIFNQKNIDALLAKIPQQDQFNIYFTVADCFEQREPGEKGRKLKEQWAIPFDIDGLEFTTDQSPIDTAAKAAKCAIEALGLEYNKTGVIFTGNGVQFFVLIDSPIVEENYFNIVRDNYHVLAKKIDQALVHNQITGKTDTSVWSPARLMRFPSTLNRKPGKPERLSAIVQGNIEVQNFDIVLASGIEAIEKASFISDQVLKNYPKPDTKAVCEGCKFLVHCKGHQKEISEPQWYAMVSITARLDNGRELTHEFSSEHGSYTPFETDEKVDQALANAGPRTCKNIETLWDGCSTCEYHEKVTSPILIKGPDYIISKDFGFRVRKKIDDGQGNAKYVPGPPAFLDLIRYFSQLTPYKLVKDSDQIIRFNGKFWEYFSDRELMAWMTDIVRPEPSHTEMREFIARLKSYNVTTLDKLFNERSKLLNFDNGVLDLATLELKAHSPEYGFFEVRPFAYDPRATAPRWEQFLLEIMSGNQDLADTLKEFAGYCISGDKPWLQKALLMVGDGSNGKSVFIRTLGQLVGKKSYSAIPMQELKKDVMRKNLVHALFNYSEETSAGALYDSEFFKVLVDGGEITVKELYVQPYTTQNRAKLVLSANNIPYSKDNSIATSRRLAIIKFNQTYSPGDGKYDGDIEQKLIQEIPGICNSLIMAYRELVVRGSLKAAKDLSETNQQYQENSDTVRMFLSEGQVEESTSGFVIVSELYAAYKAATEDMGERPLTKQGFVVQIKRIWGVDSTRESINGKQVRGYRGYKLVKDF